MKKMMRRKLFRRDNPKGIDLQAEMRNPGRVADSLTAKNWTYQMILKLKWMMTKTKMMMMMIINNYTPNYNNSK